MRTLVLMRHAKSDWSQPGVADKERSLNERGRSAAPRMARWLTSQNIALEQVLSSSSTRTRETWQRMCESDSWLESGFQIGSKIEFLDSLYLASPNEIWEQVRKYYSDPPLKSPVLNSSLLVLGHNPGMELLVAALADREVEFPTAAIAIFQSQGVGEIPDLLACIESRDWKLVKLQIPKALAD